MKKEESAQCGDARTLKAVLKKSEAEKEATAKSREFGKGIIALALFALVYGGGAIHSQYQERERARIARITRPIFAQMARGPQASPSLIGVIKVSGTTIAVSGTEINTTGKTVTAFRPDGTMVGVANLKVLDGRFRTVIADASTVTILPGLLPKR